jgi:dihydrofolate reductase / thymidylate synthase
VHARYHLDRAIVDKHAVTPAQLIAHLGKDTGVPTPAPEARNAVIMGHRTWAALPERFRPLPGRLNGVLSRNSQLKSDGTFQLWNNLDEALTQLDHDETVREIYVIGGGQIYALAMAHSHCARIYRTLIDAEFECDTFFPTPMLGFVETATSPPIVEANFTYRIALFERQTAI